MDLSVDASDLSMAPERYVGHQVRRPPSVWSKSPWMKCRGPAGRSRRRTRTPPARAASCWVSETPRGGGVSTAKPRVWAELVADPVERRVVGLRAERGGDDQRAVAAQLAQPLEPLGQALRAFLGLASWSGPARASGPRRSRVCAASLQRELLDVEVRRELARDRPPRPACRAAPLAGVVARPVRLERAAPARRRARRSPAARRVLGRLDGLLPVRRREVGPPRTPGLAPQRRAAAARARRCPWRPGTGPARAWSADEQPAVAELGDDDLAAVRVGPWSRPASSPASARACGGLRELRPPPRDLLLDLRVAPDQLVARLHGRAVQPGDPLQQLGVRQVGEPAERRAAGRGRSRTPAAPGPRAAAA